MHCSSTTNRLWTPIPSNDSNSAFFANTDHKKLAITWHQRLGHLHPDGVIQFLRRQKLIPISKNNFVSCDACSMGKLTQSPATSPFHRSPNLLNLVHSDLMGPISPVSKSGFKYVLSFIDDHS